MPTADSSLRERIERLENDLAVHPPRFVKVASLPYAILRYHPDNEWTLRRELKLLASRLRGQRKTIFISLGTLLWKAIEECEGLDTVIWLEQQRGFEAAQRQVNTYLNDDDWYPLCDLVLETIAEYGELDPRRHVVFLTRAGAMAPAIFRMSTLLNQMKGRTEVPVVLCYPGTLEGTFGLRFMDLQDREPMGNYRVTIYE